MRTRPNTIVPALQGLIANPPDPGAPGYFESAIDALGNYGTNALPALPRLKAIETDAEIPIQIRIDAAIARVSILPENREPLDFVVAQWENTNASQWGILKALERLDDATGRLHRICGRVLASDDEPGRELGTSSAVRWCERC